MFSYQPGQVVIAGGQVYKVYEVFLGAVGQVDLIGLAPITEKGQTTLNGSTLYVPQLILDCALRGSAGLYQEVEEG